MKLSTLKPRLQSVSTARVPVLTQQPGRVERKRGSAGVKDRNQIKARDCGLCQECKRRGKTSIGSVVDHKQPLWDGGTNDHDNQELLCDPCHDAKTAREAAQRAGRY